MAFHLSSMASRIGVLLIGGCRFQWLLYCWRNSSIWKPSSEVWAKLSVDLVTRGYLQQPDFLKMMQDVQRNPNNINMYLTDLRMIKVLGVLLNVTLRTTSPEEMERDTTKMDSEMEATKKDAQEPVKKEPVKKEPVKDAEPEPTEEEDDAKVEAQKVKEKGNATYKTKDFETVIHHYTKAIELNAEDISFLTNRVAVYLEMGKGYVVSK